MARTQVHCPHPRWCHCVLPTLRSTVFYSHLCTISRQLWLDCHHCAYHLESCIDIWSRIRRILSRFIPWAYELSQHLTLLLRHQCIGNLAVCYQHGLAGVFYHHKWRRLRLLLQLIPIGGWKYIWGAEHDGYFAYLVASLGLWLFLGKFASENIQSEQTC